MYWFTAHKKFGISTKILQNILSHNMVNYLKPIITADVSNLYVLTKSFHDIGSSVHCL